jgi:hypothetical protein
MSIYCIPSDTQLESEALRAITYLTTRFEGARKQSVTVYGCRTHTSSYKLPKLNFGPL